MVWSGLILRLLLGTQVPQSPVGPGEALTVELQWDSPAGCPTDDDVLRELQALVTTTVRVAAEGVVVVRGAIVRAGDAWRLTLAVTQADRTLTRELETSRCAVLATTVALIVAVEHRPLQVAARLDSVSAPLVAPKVLPVQPPVPPKSQPARSQPTVIPPPPRSESVANFTPTIGVSVGPGVGIVPGVGFGLGGAVGSRIGPWRVRLGGTAWLPRPQTNTEQRGVDLQVAAARLDGCYAVQFKRAPRLELPACVTLEVGAATARGRGPDVVSKTARALWATGGPQVELAWAARPQIALFVAAAAHLALARPAFYVGVREEVAFRAPPGGARMLMGVEIRIR